MHIFEIIIPGSWLDNEDLDQAARIRNTLESLQSEFFAANEALNLFVREFSVRPPIPSIERSQAEAQRRSEIECVIAQERGRTVPGHDFEEMEDIRFEVDVRLKREEWANGGTPWQLAHQRRFIYARAFLYSVDMFERQLAALAKEKNVPARVAELHAQLVTDFPYLRGMRNTVQHMDERLRGIGPGNRPLDLKPVTNDFIHAPSGGVLILKNLNGSRYGATMGDGNYGEIDVSDESMERLKAVLEGVLQSFPWGGPRQHAPT